jgi:hypothetical protein
MALPWWQASWKTTSHEPWNLVSQKLMCLIHWSNCHVEVLEWLEQLAVA